ncbi:hypothetical protein WR25_18292 [Diploscapter pachys]|uniref:Uncharacterized protein n=1 Tax=Diploscapter pachys TaxID=2018661 RepID=A0A2A2LEE7_9BILA|nr:hypothetical protein WR25_18292 [Diploscapter pachys]
MAPRTTFDQNDKKYQAVFGLLHIRKAAKIVSVILNVFAVINLIFGLTRSSTVLFYTFFSFAFSVVVFGSLLYGVFKEKRHYLLPYLLFQILSVAATVLTLLIFLISLAAHSNMVIDLAQDWGGINAHSSESQKQFDSDLKAFTVWFIIILSVYIIVQAYFLELIYAFYVFLKDRENSFNFNFDTSFTNGAFGSTPTTPGQLPHDAIN